MTIPNRYRYRGGDREHRVVARALLGRDFLPGEVVHHKNGLKWDNRPENLEVIASAAEHSRRYHADRRTHCVNGHEFTAENTYIRPDKNAKQCRECRRQRSKAYMERVDATPKARTKTHCKYGHELTPDNLRIRPDNGYAECRQCIRSRSQRKAA